MPTGDVIHEGWFANKRHGYGHGERTVKYEDGSEYSIEWSADKRDGKSKMKHKDGSKYQGKLTPQCIL